MNMYLHCCCFWRSFCGENHALFCLFSTLIIIDQYSADTYVHVYVRTYVRTCMYTCIFIRTTFLPSLSDIRHALHFTSTITVVCKGHVTVHAQQISHQFFGENSKTK